MINASEPHSEIDLEQTKKDWTAVAKFSFSKVARAYSSLVTSLEKKGVVGGRLDKQK